MRRINTLAELKAERKALILRKAELEASMKNDIEGIKADLEPVFAMAKGAKNFLSSKDNSVLGTSAGTAANFIAKHTLFRNSGFITRLIMPFLVKNATSNIVEQNKSKIIDWVETLVSKFRNREKAEENA
ncbi:MAG: hypothetical protein ACJ77K_09140 [Bacteroidia bacterium]